MRREFGITREDEYDEHQAPNDVSVYDVIGRLDSTNSSAVDTQITSRLEEERPFLVVNLLDTEYVSSAGMRELVWLHKKCCQSNRSLALVIDEDEENRVRQVLDLTGLSSIFHVFPTVEEAIEFFK